MSQATTTASAPAAAHRAAPPSATPDAPWKPRANPWLITVAVMMGTFMEVLDTSVANVSLPHIAGNLSASIDESTWVLTSYLVANAIVLPMTGWLGRQFGRKRLLMTCMALFALASFACGAAPTLAALVTARVIQGIGGGGLQPIAQAVLLESFPAEKRGKAMAAYTFGIIFAPVIGPTIGGWITDNYSWRWVFYINIPISILAIAMVNWVVEDPPYLRGAKPGGIDYVGFGFLALWVGLFQIILDKGQEDDWLGAPWIRWAVVVVAVAFILFIAWELLARHPVVDLRVLRDRNFAAGCMIAFVVGIVLYSTTALLPLFLQDLMGYSALKSGLAVSPRGLGSVVAILFVGNLVGVIDSRLLIAVALAVLGYSSFLLGHVSLEITPFDVTWPIIINGLAVSALFIPLTTTTVSTLRLEQLNGATGIYNLLRNMGGAVGISLATTMLARSSQVHQVTLAGHITPYSHTVQESLRGLRQLFITRGGDPVAAARMSDGMLYRLVQQQASLWSYVDAFRMLGVLCLVCIPLVLLLRPARRRAGVLMEH